jgi:hypothetical protein
MNLLRLIIEIFVLYLLYKLVVDFIIPVYRTTKIMKEKMAEVQKNMESEKAKKPGTPGEKEGEYIDFEDVK